MAKKSHNKRHKGHRRGRRGGALAPLEYGKYPHDSGTSWNTSVSGSGPAAAASAFNSSMKQITGGATGMAASVAMNKYAMEGAGQGGAQSGG